MAPTGPKDSRVISYGVYLCALIVHVDMPAEYNFPTSYIACAVLPSSLYFISFLMRILWKIVSKALLESRYITSTVPPPSIKPVTLS